MFNFYVWKQESFGWLSWNGAYLGKDTSIWAGFEDFYCSKLQLVLCKRLTLSAASIFVTEGLFICTLLQNKRGRWFWAPSPSVHLWTDGVTCIDILYIILKGILWRFRFNLNFSKIFWFRDFMSNYGEMTPQWLQNGCPKKIQTFKIWTYYI